ncbi:MAG TPA: cytochrome c peroxidase [Polyangiaceae bacterium]|nr:cytochrome c peroxidase [Polyangiaceae bacterium]
MGAELRLAALAGVALLTACGSSNDGAGNDAKPAAAKAPDARAAFAELHYDAAPPPEDPSNRVADDPRARALGQRLFFDASLSGPLIEGDNDGTGGTLGMRGEAGRVSCAGCHVPNSGYVDTRSPHHQISLGAEWTSRRTPSLLEVAYAPLYNWDGRRDSIWGQAVGVMEGQKEFNSGRLFVATQMFALHRAEYEALFGEMPALDDKTRFPALAPTEAGCVEVRTMSGATYTCRGKPGDGAEYDAMAPEDQTAVTRVTVNTAKALAAYVRQLRCGASRFDAWLDGDDTALTASEQRGAALFVGRGRCVSCHSGPNLTDEKFHDIGLSPASVAVAFTDTGDRGASDGIDALREDPLNTSGAFSDGDRHAIPATTDPALVGAFRTPSLRCLSSHPSFLHTAQLATLEEVVAFHDRGGDPSGGYPGTNELVPLGLTDGEQTDLVGFLKTLDGPGPSAALLVPPQSAGSP